MSRQPEARLQVRIVKALRSRGIPAWRIRPMGLAGWPDLYAIRDGRAVHLEVKMPGGRATKLQERRLEELREAGAVVGVVSSVEEALELVMPRPQCPDCGQEIDPDVCGCGGGRSGHDYENHPFIPMGCDCYRVR